MDPVSFILSWFGVGLAIAVLFSRTAFTEQEYLDVSDLLFACSLFILGWIGLIFAGWLVMRVFGDRKVIIKKGEK